MFVRSSTKHGENRKKLKLEKKRNITSVKGVNEEIIPKRVILIVILKCRYLEKVKKWRKIETVTDEEGLSRRVEDIDKKAGSSSSKSQ